MTSARGTWVCDKGPDAQKSISRTLQVPNPVAGSRHIGAWACWAGSTVLVSAAGVGLAKRG
jgi:hypothetical protein